MKKSEKTSVYVRILNSLGLTVTAGAVVYGIYIMANHLGLAESLDFGAGAYYYADMPGFERLVNGSYYTSQTPMWVLIVLFLAWGFVMYRFWVWLDKRTK